VPRHPLEQSHDQGRRQKFPQVSGEGDAGIHAQGAWNDEFSKQLYSEAKKPVVNKLGFTEDRWQVVGKRPNHLWDCFCMIHVRCFMYRILGECGIGG
jgi:hypothetical protein